ncbi:hypothetical protein U1Q18_052098 [Sarracenia purpurea var. burkii]
MKEKLNRGNKREEALKVKVNPRRIEFHGEERGCVCDGLLALDEYDSVKKSAWLPGWVNGREYEVDLDSNEMSMSMRERCLEMKENSSGLCDHSKQSERGASRHCSSVGKEFTQTAQSQPRHVQSANSSEETDQDGAVLQAREGAPERREAEEKEGGMSGVGRRTVPMCCCSADLPRPVESGRHRRVGGQAQTSPCEACIASRARLFHSSRCITPALVLKHLHGRNRLGLGIGCCLGANSYLGRADENCASGISLSESSPSALQSKARERPCCACRATFSQLDGDVVSACAPERLVISAEDDSGAFSRAAGAADDSAVASCISTSASLAADAVDAVVGTGTAKEVTGAKGGAVDEANKVCSDVDVDADACGLLR